MTHGKGRTAFQKYVSATAHRATNVPCPAASVQPAASRHHLSMQAATAAISSISSQNQGTVGGFLFLLTHPFKNIVIRGFGHGDFLWRDICGWSRGRGFRRLRFYQRFVAGERPQVRFEDASGRFCKVRGIGQGQRGTAGGSGKAECRAAHSETRAKLTEQVQTAERAFRSAERAAKKYGVTVENMAKAQNATAAAIGRTEAALGRQQKMLANHDRRKEYNSQILGTVATAAAVVQPVKLAIDYESNWAASTRLPNSASRRTRTGSSGYFCRIRAHRTGAE